MLRASLPAADASDTSLRAVVEDNLAHRLRATAMEGGRAHDAIHRGFQSDRFGRDFDPDYPLGICLPALSEEAGSTMPAGLPPGYDGPLPAPLFPAYLCPAGSGRARGPGLFAAPPIHPWLPRRLPNLSLRIKFHTHHDEQRRYRRL